MAKDAQLLVRMTLAMRKQVDRAKRESGMTLKAIMGQAIKEWLDRRKRDIGTE